MSRQTLLAVLLFLLGLLIFSFISCRFFPLPEGGEQSLFILLSEKSQFANPENLGNLPSLDFSGPEKFSVRVKPQKDKLHFIKLKAGKYSLVSAKPETSDHEGALPYNFELKPGTVFLYPYKIFRPFRRFIDVTTNFGINITLPQVQKQEKQEAAPEKEGAYYILLNEFINLGKSENDNLKPLFYDVLKLGFGNSSKLKVIETTDIQARATEAMRPDFKKDIIEKRSSKKNIFAISALFGANIDIMDSSIHPNAIRTAGDGPKYAVGLSYERVLSLPLSLTLKFNPCKGSVGWDPGYSFFDLPVLLGPQLNFRRYKRYGLP